jgi:sialate O-acetylesterase
MSLLQRLAPTFSLLAVLGFSSAMCAEVKLPTILADHMVLQRDMPIRIWGMASPGEKVNVDLNGDKGAATADASGHWSVDLAPLKAGGPYELHANNVTLHDILLGDVWLAAGQSNMGQTLEAYQKKDTGDHSDRAATDTDIRLFNATKVASTVPLDNVKADMVWTRCNPTAVEDFSALGYFFAKDIRAEEHVPIGVIEAAWGETAAAIWIDRDSLAADPILAKLVTGGGAEKKNKKGEARPTPGGTFNSIIHPILPLRIKGVIWYQGSNDSKPDLAPLYSETMKVLFTSWRAKWGEGNFPVVLAQLGPFPGNGPGDTWPVLRQAQLEFLRLPNTAMEVTTDARPLSELHDNHAVNKPLLAGRMALGAEAIAYGKHIEYMGPIYDRTAVDGSTLRVFFTHDDSGLVAANTGLEQFEIAGADGKFVAATAKIDGKTVLVSSPAVPHPTFARFEWVPVPSTSLFNGDKLPASPFNSQIGK